MVAEALDLPFVDTDEVLARRSGAPIPQLWRERGEASFRALEASLVRELTGDGVARVFAFGGGTMTMREVRERVFASGAVVVTLTASPEALSTRLEDFETRPVLAGTDPGTRIRRLLEERAAVYAECHLIVATDVLSPDEAVREIVREAARHRVLVPLGLRSYGVHVTWDEPDAVRSPLARLQPSTLVVVTDATVRQARGPAITACLPAGVPTIDVDLPAGEEHKTLATVERIWNAALEGSIDRQAVVVAFGGGVVGDLAGFAASTLLRGLRVVQVPTTLLAMVDASVGGKTGFDTPLGKNLIGAFHQPTAVIADLAHLSTLPARDIRAGLAEVAKVALACDDALWGLLERDAEALRACDLDALTPVVYRAIAHKARIVAADEREGGPRALLNLGHTVGHALEAASGYATYRHGEAVALGLVAETRVAERLGVAPTGLAERARSLLARLGLPTEVAAGQMATAWSRVAYDKKRDGATIRLPLPSAVGSAAVVPVLLTDLARALGASTQR